MFITKAIILSEDTCLEKMGAHCYEISWLAFLKLKKNWRLAVSINFGRLQNKIFRISCIFSTIVTKNTLNFAVIKDHYVRLYVLSRPNKFEVQQPRHSRVMMKECLKNIPNIRYAIRAWSLVTTVKIQVQLLLWL